MSRKTRKLIWAAPLVAVFAVAGALALFMTLTPNDASAQTSSMVPGIPGNLVATGDSPTSIDLTWDAPTDGDTPDGYRLDYSEDDAVWFSLAANHTSTAYTHSGLKERQTIHYRVFAYNTIGTSGVSQIAMGTTEMSEAPDAPEDFVAADNTDATDAARTEIGLTWEAPDNPDGAPVTKYTIQVSSNGRSYGLLKEVSPKDAGCATGTACTYTHKKLLENTQRWYRVYATNSVGTSSASLSDDGMTAEGRIPTGPERLRAGLNRTGRMVLYWDPPQDESDATKRDAPAGAPITGYYVQGGPVAAAGTPTAFVTVPAGTVGETNTSRLYPAGDHTSAVLTTSVLSNFRKPDYDGPDNEADQTGDNQQWGFRVAAINRVVERKLSDGTIDLDGTDDDLAWSEVFVRVNDRARDYPAETDTREDTTVGTIKPSDDLDGDGSITDNVDDDMVERPTLTGKKVSNVNGGRTSIELKWKAGRNEETAGVNTTDFWLEYSTDGIDWKPIAVDTGDTAGDPTDELMYVHPDRTAGTTYHYRVFAAHENTIVGNPAASVRSEASLEESVTTADADTPDAPNLRSAEPQSEEEIMLEWTSPGATASEAVGYGKVTAYKVEVSEDGTNWSDLVVIKGPKDTLTYTWDGSELSSKAKPDDDKITLVHAGLSQGETKYYRVATVNNAPTRKATSVPSNGLKATTDGALKADSPGGLVVKADGHSTIKLLWNARAPDIAAAPVTGYKILVSPLNSAGDDCAEDWDDLLADTMSTTTSYDHTRLMPETGRCYQVFGINDVAVSTGFVGYGDPYPATKDNDAIATTSASTAPGMPTAVMTEVVSDTHIRVSWTAPASDDSAITGYQVEYTPDGGTAMTYSCACADGDANLSAANVTLMASTEYSIRVRAMNASGYGEWSDVVTATTMAAGAADLGMASNLMIGINTGGTIQVTWDAAPNALGYIVIAVQKGDSSMVVSHPVNPDADGLTATTLNLGGLTVGNEYRVFVAATGRQGENTLSDFIEVTAE